MRKFFKSLTLVFSMACLFGTVAEARIKFKHYLRFEYEGTISYGELRAGRVYELSAAPFEGGEPTGNQYAPTSIKLLAPVTPTNIFLGKSSYVYGDEPSNVEKNDAMILISARESIKTPVNYAGQMAIIIGKDAQNISEESAKDHIFGVTGANLFNENLASIGPVIVTGIDFNKLRLETRVDGDVVQAGTTADMIDNVAMIVSKVSRNHDLKAGDIIFTGSPSKTGSLQPGSKVIVTLEGVGGLANTTE